MASTISASIVSVSLAEFVSLSLRSLCALSPFLLSLFSMSVSSDSLSLITGSFSATEKVSLGDAVIDDGIMSSAEGDVDSILEVTWKATMFKLLLVFKVSVTIFQSIVKITATEAMDTVHVAQRDDAAKPAEQQKSAQDADKETFEVNDESKVIEKGDGMILRELISNQTHRECRVLIYSHFVNHIYCRFLDF